MVCVTDSHTFNPQVKWALPAITPHLQTVNSFSIPLGQKAELACNSSRLAAVIRDCRYDRTYIRPLSHWKLISKFMLICYFCKKISSVNSQLSKERNFEILFCNLEHVIFCEMRFCGRNFAYGALWLVSRQCLQTLIWSVDDVGFQKFIFSVKVLSFERKIWKFLFRNRISKKNFLCERGLTLWCNAALTSLIRFFSASSSSLRDFSAAFAFPPSSPPIVSIRKAYDTGWHVFTIDVKMFSFSFYECFHYKKVLV